MELATSGYGTNEVPTALKLSSCRGRPEVMAHSQNEATDPCETQASYVSGYNCGSSFARMRVDGVIFHAASLCAISHVRSGTGRPAHVVKSQNSRLRNTQRSEEDAHGYTTLL